ncbi:MAG: dual specificity protein phosphatase family protein [Candidatus Izimaplasma sp.]|nr:dual specificity protein phosphatase family protein [Candidatus Izimaplasma bacterium]
MIEVYDNLYVGNQLDYQRLSKKEDYFIVQACKEPYHRRALGYSGRGAPKNHPEYLFAYRDNRLICNLVDANDHKYFSREIIIESLKFIREHLTKNSKVLIHCNKGFSRSTIIAMLYLKEIGELSESFETAETEIQKLYPNYNPGRGARDFALIHWNENLI